MVVTAEHQAGLVRDELANACILSEPSARNTAACIGFAAAVVEANVGDAPMLCLPADHLIQGSEQILSVYRQGVELARQSDVLVTIGVKPDKPETGYGYIRRGLPIEAPGECAGHAFAVRQFVEKPNLDTAVSYLESGEYYWNSGMFVWRPSVILAALERFVPETVKKLRVIVSLLNNPGASEEIAGLYREIESESIDVAVMERAENVVMISGDSFGWSDIGSWSSWAENEERSGSDERGNVVRGDGLMIDSSGTAVFAGSRLVVTVGVEDLIIVDTDDAILVCRKDRAQDVKKVVDMLKARNRQNLL
jgi:mannose-1-phosphate guanylyltransferase